MLVQSAGGIAAEVGESPAFLRELVALIAAAGLVGYLSFRIRVVPIVGFLLAGVIIGPHALGLVRDQEVVEIAAEIGVILLLFSIGLEFSLARLAEIRRQILLGGGLQVLLTTGLTVALLTALGVPWPTGVFSGFLLSLSSTAIVLKLLGGRGEMSTPHGRAGLAYLLFQDLAVVVMVLVIPLFKDGGGSAFAVLRPLVIAIAVIATVLVVARRVMPRVLERVARTCSPELFLLTVVAICFGTAFVTSLAGVSVSLGAFLAGLLVSESEHSEHAFGEIMPLQILFSATFFVSIGMLLDLGFLVRELPLVAAGVLIVLTVKSLSTYVPARLLGLNARSAAAVTLLLVQVGEFSFVLEIVGRDAGLSPAGLGTEGSQAFIAVTVLMMVMTPWLAGLGSRLAAGPSGTAPAPPAVDGGPPDDHQYDHVLISGYGVAARTLAEELRAARVPFTVVTLSPSGAIEAAERGYEVLRGDSAKVQILRQAGITRSRMIVVADDDEPMTLRIATLARQLNSAAVIAVRPREQVSSARLTAAGVDRIVDPARTSSAALTDGVLADLHITSPRPGSVDISTVIRLGAAADLPCAHFTDLRALLPESAGCSDCHHTGQTWLRLRVCMTCGHVGCCDSSPNQHARAHFEASDHPIVRSMEPDEDWDWWCYTDAKAST